MASGGIIDALRSPRPKRLAALLLLLLMVHGDEGLLLLIQAPVVLQGGREAGTKAWPPSRYCQWVCDMTCVSKL